MRKRSRKQVKNERRRIVPIEAKTENQKDYIRDLVENDVIFCIGPSGSGKSFIAAGIAANKIFKNEIDQIIVTRPLVCAGKDIGSLPGELDDKIKPYLLPMEENLKYFLGRDYYGKLFNDRRIRYEPLELMRGATFNDSYMILDEAQNCTIEQIKMFITRMGKESKVMINGDIRQTDIRNFSGLMDCVDRLEDVEGVATSRLYNEDIQRNGIIGRVLEALEEEYDD
jgi:phosphate starvation-inducible PhoH-like protein|tara:strand:+ start:621 stop:1298 length:678 start_codon:yes stop_codon:yes gene_type:complete